METATLNKKGLGQYFTPVSVVDFILDMVKEIGGFKPDYMPRLIDPACGEGVFLERALDKNIGIPSTIVGIDIDERVQEAWKESGIDRVLNGNLFIQNGLCDTADETVCEQSNDGLFDFVVGNPPYGGVGLSNVEADPVLRNALTTFELWKLGNDQNGQNDQEGLFQNDVLNDHKTLTKNEIERIERFPIELFFVERFIRLAKPGGVIGVIVPDGILANVNYAYVRKWILERCNIVAIVSLPHNVFRKTGTTAKTSILFLQKKEVGVKPDEKVFMAQIEEDDIEDNGGKAAFDFVLDKFISNYEGYTHNSPRMWKDITHGDLDPKVRWDADYYDPKYRIPIEELKRKWEVKLLGEYIELITYGSTAKMVYSDSGVFSVKAVNITDIGIDYVSNPKFVDEKSDCFVSRSELKLNDILVIRSGKGSIGRVAVFTKQGLKACASQDVDLVRLKEINPYYVALFLKTKLGKLQIERAESGVSGVTHLRFTDIKNFHIPLIDDSYARECEKTLKKILKKYDRFLSDKAEVINGQTKKSDSREEAINKADSDFEQRYLRLKTDLDKYVILLEEYLME